MGLSVSFKSMVYEKREARKHLEQERGSNDNNRKRTKKAVP
jgi:hypothetical protein